MAEQNPLEEKIKELEERAKQLHEDEAKKKRAEKIEKEPILTFSEKPITPLKTKKERQKLSRSSLDLMPSVLATAPSFTSSEKRSHYDVPWIYKYSRRKYVLSILIVGLIGFLFAANTPYFNKWYQEKKRISSYNSRLHNIQDDIVKKRYDGIEAKVRALANDLENEKRQRSLFAYKTADKNLKKLESLSYTKLAKVEARTERIVDQPGHYEQAWVSPEYEKNVAVGIAKGTIMVLTTPIAVLLPPPMKESETFKKFGNWMGNNEVKVKDGHYEKKWIEPTYKDIVIPAHYQKLEINPYNSIQKIVEDNIPIK